MTDYKPTQTVLAICTAYEAGFGDGVDGLDKRCPYIPGSDSYHAWMYGVEQGSRMRARQESRQLNALHANSTAGT